MQGKGYLQLIHVNTLILRQISFAGNYNVFFYSSLSGRNYNVFSKSNTL